LSFSFSLLYEANAILILSMQNLKTPDNKTSRLNNCNNGFSALRFRSGFTIVELLVVIVVIGILAAITIVSYAGIANKATGVRISSELSSNSKLLKLYNVEHGYYPSTLDQNNCPITPDIDSNYCLKISPDLDLTYTGSGQVFSLTLTQPGPNIGYEIDENGIIAEVVGGSQVATTFVNAWGGTGNDYGASIAQTSDGGYVVTGQTESYGAGYANMFIAKYADDGSLSWDQTWGGAVSDSGNSIIQTNDGGYAVTGETQSYGNGSSDMFIAKYTDDGTLSWDQTWGGTGNNFGSSVVQTSDNGYAVVGSTQDEGAGDIDMFITKYAANGDLSWAKTWGGIDYYYGNSIIQSSDGGYIVVGDFLDSDTGNSDMFISKYTDNGNLSWIQNWIGIDFESGSSVIQSGDGGYVVTGITNSYGAGNNDMFIAKYANDGNLSWSKTWGGTGDDEADEITNTNDGGYIVTGETSSYGAGYFDIFIAKYTADGSLSWSQTWGGLDDEYGSSTTQINDGSYVVTGSTYSYGAGNMDMFIAKFSSTGEITDCNSTMCQSPIATVMSPVASVASPNATAVNPIVSTTNPTATITNPDAIITAIVPEPPASEDPPPDAPADTFNGDSIITTSDGGYVVNGLREFSDGVTGNTSLFIAKYDSAKLLEWAKTWEDGADYGDSGITIQTNDGGFVVATSFFETNDSIGDAILIRYDADGNFVWSSGWGTSMGDDITSIAQTSDGGYIATGTSNIFNDTESFAYMFLVKYDSSGVIDWIKMRGGDGDIYAPTGATVIQTSDGGYAVTGYNNATMFISKYSSNGTLIWNKNWGMWGTYGRSVAQTSDGGFVVTGQTSYYTEARASDMFIVKYDADGILEWDNVWGGNDWDRGLSVIQTIDGGYAVTGTRTFDSGTSGSSSFLVKYNSSGVLTWSKTWGDANYAVGYSVKQHIGGNYTVTGLINGGYSGLFVLSYLEDGSIFGCSAPICQDPTVFSGDSVTEESTPFPDEGTPTINTFTPSLVLGDLLTANPNIVFVP